MACLTAKTLRRKAKLSGVFACLTAKTQRRYEDPQRDLRGTAASAARQSRRHGRSADDHADALPFWSGIYRQFPALERLNGLRGEAGLKPELATHVDAGLSRMFARGINVQVTAYAREERDILRALARSRAGSPLLRLRSAAATRAARIGWTRGVEALIRRDSATGLSGWIAYAYARHRYDDPQAGETFWSDFDQRHTFSAFGLYRVSNRTSVGTKFRSGSNYPMTGYVGDQPISPNAPPLLGGDRPIFYGLTGARNTLRLPVYARLDVRVDRVVTWFNRRVTLFVEVANALNRENQRNVPYSVERNGRIGSPTESLLPIVPSAGLIVEF